MIASTLEHKLDENLQNLSRDILLDPPEGGHWSVTLVVACIRNDSITTINSLYTAPGIKYTSCIW